MSELADQAEALELQAAQAAEEAPLSEGAPEAPIGEEASTKAEPSSDIANRLLDENKEKDAEIQKLKEDLRKAKEKKVKKEAKEKDGQKIKLKDSISSKTFLGFVGALMIFYFTNVPMGFELGLESGPLRFLVYLLSLTALVVLGIERPGVYMFITQVLKLIFDNNLSAEQKLAMIRKFAMELLGYWADLSLFVATEGGDPMGE